MTEFKRVLVPLDLSLDSGDVLRAALDVVGDRRAEIVLLHVIESPWQSGAQAEVADDSISARLRSDADRRLCDLAKAEIGKASEVRLIIRDGRPFLEIVRAARELGADLIVIGSAGYSADAYSILGSTAERVARKAACPVLLVRDKGRDFS